MASLQKNVGSQNLPFALVNSSNGGASTTSSTSSLTAFVTKDGTQGTAAGTFTYLGTGEWNYVPTSGETNVTSFGFYVTASGNIPFHATIWTDPGVLLSQGTGTNQISLSGGAVTVGTNNDKSGYSLTQAFPTNFANMAITSSTGSTGGVTVAVNGDKSGYSLTQAFPVNFAAMAITSSTGSTGAVTVGTNNDKAGYTLTATAYSSFADVILDRDMSLGVDSGSSSVRTPRQAWRVLRNKVDVSSGTTLIVYKEDDATQSWTAAVTVSSAAQPIVTLTPP